MHAGGKEADLQIRFVPGCALDPDGIGSYSIFGQLNKKNMKWPSGITFQLLAIRPKCARRLPALTPTQPCVLKTANPKKPYEN